MLFPAADLDWRQVVSPARYQTIKSAAPYLILSRTKIPANGSCKFQLRGRIHCQEKYIEENGSDTLLNTFGTVKSPENSPKLCTIVGQHRIKAQSEERNNLSLCDQDSKMKMLGSNRTARNHENSRSVQVIPTFLGSKRHLNRGADDSSIRNQSDIISHKFVIAPTRDCACGGDWHHSIFHVQGREYLPGGILQHEEGCC